MNNTQTNANINAKKHEQYHSRKQIRLTGYDYSLPGYYFVTVCTQERKNILGKIVNEEMKLNKYGEIVKNEWLKTPQIRKYINLDEFQIMPNHLHAIIIINNSVGTYCHTPANKKQTTNTGLCNKPCKNHGINHHQLVWGR